MSVNINDTFQIKLHGQIVDCIKAEALNRESEKTASGIYFCTYDRAMELLSLKMESSESFNDIAWVSKSAGYCSNADGSYTTFVPCDVLQTVYADGKYTTTKFGNLFPSDNNAKTTIYSSMEAVYAAENVDKGTFILVTSKDDEDNTVYSIYTKITDTTGTTTAKDWQAVSSGGGGVSSYMKLPDRPTIYYVLKAGNETDDDAIARVISDPNYQDIAILKTTSDNTENGDVIELISYIYDGAKFVLMYGNMPADKIMITKNFELAGAWDTVGNIKKSDKLIDVGNGITLWDFIDKMLNGIVTPTVKTNPSIKIVATFTDYLGNAITNGLIEIGSVVNKSYEISFVTTGLYECAGVTEDIAATISSYAIQTISSGSNSNYVTGDFADLIVEDIATTGALTMSNSNSRFIVPEGYDKKMKIYAYVSTIKYATNNKGVKSEVIWAPEEKSVNITNGNQTHVQRYTLTSETISLKSYRMGCFYGPVKSVYYSNTITSDVIRTLIKLNSPYPTSKTSKSFSVVSGDAQILVAIPSGNKVPTLYNNTVYSGLDVTKLATIPVNSASGDNPIDYDIYAYTPSLAFRTTNSISLTINV